ncbi:MAG: hypothetical protein ACLFO3_06305, partial [Candidatus Acetothermia bacterium]
MNIWRQIKQSIRVTSSFPILFLPLFAISVLSTILASDALLASLGAGTSLGLNLVILLFLAPPAMGIIIIWDRQIVNKGEIDSSKGLRTLLPKYPLLIGAYLVSWVATILGLFAFLLPGFYIMIKFMFVNQEIILDGEENLEKVLKLSWKQTTGHWLRLFSLTASLMVPLLAIELMTYELPPGVAATISTVLGAALQTWLRYAEAVGLTAEAAEA